MANSLENQFIDQSYQKVVQVSGSFIADGTGSVITNLNVTASHVSSPSDWNGQFTGSAGISGSLTVDGTQIYNGTVVQNAGNFENYVGGNISMFGGNVGGTTMGFSDGSSTLTGSFSGDGSGLTNITAQPSISASYALSASHADSANSSQTATSASHAVQADNATTAGTATSVAYNNITGKPTLVSGSSQIILQDTTGDLSGSRIDGAVANATNAISSSHAVQADSAISSQTSISASHAVNADAVGLFTKTITDGTEFQVLRTDGAGNLSFDYSDRTQSEIRTTEAITKGDPLYVVGFNNGQNRIEVGIADASDPSKMPSFGLAYETVGNNQNSQMVNLGSLDDIDTQVTYDFQVGDTVYVAVGGGLTNVKPTGTNLIQNVGVVGRRNQNNGEILVSAIGRSNDLPNIASGNIWAGNASGVPTATSTGSFAKTDKNNSFSGTQTFNNINVNGTGSFAYIESITGSAKTIGDAFIILNNDTPTQRYAGIKVQDSGSLNNTASIQYDGSTDDWFFEKDVSGATEFGVFLGGPEYTTLGTPTYNANNKILKGTGGHHVVDSSITDTGALVTVANPLTVTGTIQGNLTGNVTGNASTATSASHALVADSAGTSNSVAFANITGKPTLVSGSSQIDLAQATGTAATAISASHALVANSAGTATSVAFTNITGKPALVSGSSQITLTDTTGNLDGGRITGTVANATSASHALQANNATTANSSTTASYVEYSNISGKPAGLVSSSAQVDVTQTTNYVTPVDLTTNQSIGGNKTFTGTTTFNGQLDQSGGNVSIDAAGLLALKSAGAITMEAAGYNIIGDGNQFGLTSLNFDAPTTNQSKALYNIASASIGSLDYNRVFFGMADFPSFGNLYEDYFALEYYDSTGYNYGSELAVNGVAAGFLQVPSGSGAAGRSEIRLKDNLNSSGRMDILSDTIDGIGRNVVQFSNTSGNVVQLSGTNFNLIAQGGGGTLNVIGSLSSTAGISVGTQLTLTNYANLDFADDSAAATGGVPLGGIYRTGGDVKVRIT